MAGRKHLIAVNRAIRQADLDEHGLDGPMVELVRDLARKMDGAGKDGPPLNLLRAYLSATKDLARAAARKRPAQRGATPGETPAAAAPEPTAAPDLRIVEEKPLDRIRRQKEQRQAG